MKILTVVGNRPQFVKAAAVSQPLRERHSEVLVHTGQHYDNFLSQVFFDELEIPKPDIELGVGSGSNTAQVAKMLAALEGPLRAQAPDCVLVYGDTNSTLAGALVATQIGIPVAHVEAGMRSFDRAMPEETNRVLTDHLSSLLLCSSEVATRNLVREAAAGRIELVGDVMVDLAMRIQPVAKARSEALKRFGLESGRYLLVTIHRAGTVDDSHRLAAAVELIGALPGPTILPLHPRTKARLAQTGLLERLATLPDLRLIDPLGYLDFTNLLCNAKAVLTDSGGVQKEAYLAGVRCVTLRAETEWVETVESGWNTLVDLDLAGALAAISAPLPDERPAFYGGGKAAERVVLALESLTDQTRK